MKKELSKFESIPLQSDIWSAQKGNLRCTALRLRDGSLCLYSPVLGLGGVAKDSLTDLGKVSHLLAPNHYHHKGLKEYSEAFPEAKLVCSERAHPRLAQQTGLPFANLQTVAPLLPDDCNFAEPDGLKTGEVWLTLETPSGSIWIVCDSFKGPNGKVGNVGTNIGLLGTFPTYGIRDTDAYSKWIKAGIQTQAPSMIVPCHGSIVQSDTLAADILALQYA